MVANFPLYRFRSLFILLLVFVQPFQKNTLHQKLFFDWKQRGIEGSVVLEVVVDPINPSIIYAGTQNGVYKSADGGITWNEKNNSLITFYNEVPDVYAIAIDNNQPQFLYIGTGSGGVFKSTNGGESWQEINQDLTTLHIRRILIDPFSSTTIYAGTLGFNGKGGIYKSIDSGQTWMPVNTGIPIPAHVNALVIDPNTPNLLYVALAGKGLYRSMDGAATWEAYNNGLDTFFIESLYLYSGVPNVLYAGSAFGQVYQKASDQTQWSKIGSSGPPRPVTSLFAMDVNTIYKSTEGAGVFKTANGGTSWEIVNQNLSSTYISAMVPSRQDGIIFLATQAGVFASTDGSVWEQRSQGLPLANIDVLLKDPVNSMVLYAVTSGGCISKSIDGGLNWTPACSGITDTQILSLEIYPSSPNVLYAGTFYDGFFISQDGGSTWSASNTGLSWDVNRFNPIRTIAIDPLSPSIIYVAVPAVSPSIHGGVFRSLNGGSTWNRLTYGLIDADDDIYSLVIPPYDPQIIFATYNGGVVKSIDGGSNWIKADEGILHSYPQEIYMDPINPSILFTNPEGKLYRSMNAGASWSPTNLNHTARSLVVDPDDSNTLYAGTEGFGVYWSEDSGETWFEFNEGFGIRYGRNYVDALVMMSNPTKSLLAGTSEGLFNKMIEPLHFYIPLILQN